LIKHSIEEHENSQAEGLLRGYLTQSGRWEEFASGEVNIDWENRKSKADRQINSPSSFLPLTYSYSRLWFLFVTLLGEVLYSE
jgi:hypothetical protein